MQKMSAHIGTDLQHSCWLLQAATLGTLRLLLPPSAQLSSPGAARAELTWRCQGGGKHEEQAGRDAWSAPHGCYRSCLLNRSSTFDECACEAWEAGGHTASI